MREAVRGSSPIAPNMSKAAVEARMTESSRHLGSLMKDPESKGTAAPKEKQIIEDRAACSEKGL